jgi:hypothetical protein
VRLLGILRRLTEHEGTRGNWALKGGTALNVFHLDLPRMSVDIDVNFLGAIEREQLPDLRASFERALSDCCALEGCAVKRAPTEHAGGKFRLQYSSVVEGAGRLEVDVNYVSRVPLLGVEQRAHRMPSIARLEVPSLSLQELAAGKSCALLDRGLARDYFDVREIANARPGVFETPAFRVAFTCAAGASRSDMRAAKAPVPLKPIDVADRLLPMLRFRESDVHPSADELSNSLNEAVLRLALRLVEWSPAEREFLDRLNDRGEIAADLLTDDAEMQDRVRRQPMLAWKAQNVRLHTRKKAD